jgi:hypothetical protein
VAAEAAHFVLAREPETIELLARRYAEWRGRGRSSGPALIHFPPRHRYTGKCYAAASAGAIAALS